MVIGIVVHVMESEHSKGQQAKAVAEGHITMADIQQELAEIKLILKQH